MNKFSFTKNTLPFSLSFFCTNGEVTMTWAIYYLLSHICWLTVVVVVLVESWWRGGGIGLQVCKALLLVPHRENSCNLARKSLSSLKSSELRSDSFNSVNTLLYMTLKAENDAMKICFQEHERKSVLKEKPVFPKPFKIAKRNF